MHHQGKNPYVMFPPILFGYQIIQSKILFLKAE